MLTSESLQCIRRLNCYGEKILHAAWSSNGLMIGACITDGSVQVWNVGVEIPMSNFSVKGKSFRSIIWSPDNQVIAVLSGDHKIYILGLCDNYDIYIIREIETNAKCVATFSFSKHSKHINVGIVTEVSNSLREEFLIKSWDIYTSDLVKSFNNEQWTEFYSALSTDRRFIAFSLPEHIIQILDIQTFQVVCELESKFCKIHSVALSPDQVLAVIALGNGVVEVWNCVNGNKIYSLVDHDEKVYTSCFSHDASLLVTKSLDNTVRLWCCKNWRSLAILPERSVENEETELVFNPTKLEFISFGRKNTVIQIWSLNSAALLSREHKFEEENFQIDPMYPYPLFTKLEEIFSTIKAMSEQPKYEFQNVHNLQINDSGSTGIQNNYIDPNIKLAIDDLRQLVTDLQFQYPYAAEEQVLTIIDAQFHEIKHTQPQRWQNLLKLKRLWNGVKKGSFKVGEHFAEETPWGKAIIGFLEGVTDNAE